MSEMQTAFTKKFDRNNLQSDLLKQHWAPFFNLPGAFLQHVGPSLHSKKRYRKNVMFYLTQHWLELANHRLNVTRQFLWLDSTKSWLDS